MSVMIDFLYIKGILLLVLSANLYNTQNHFSGVLQFGKVNLNVSFVTLYEIEDLGTCQQNCVDRQKCVALNYHTQFPYECVLNYEDGDLEDRFGWVHQSKPEILMQTPCFNCNYNQTCDRSTLKCVYRECEPILSNEEYIRLGNGNTIGSRAVLACPSGTYPVSLYQVNTWPITVVCQDDGQWSFPWRPKCAEFDEHFCQTYSVNPDPSVAFKSWSNYIKKTVQLVSGPCGVGNSDIISSSDHHEGFFAYMSKFDYKGDTWVSGKGDENPFIQVNFSRITEVKGIKIKGREAPDSLEYPTLINVTYSTNCSQDMLESVVRNRTGGSEFNTNGTSIVEHLFEPPINALCVRVNVLDYTNSINETYFGMKFDLFGTLKLPIL